MRDQGSGVSHKELGGKRLAVGTEGKSKEVGGRESSREGSEPRIEEERRKKCGILTFTPPPAAGSPIVTMGQDSVSTWDKLAPGKHKSYSASCSCEGPRQWSLVQKVVSINI